LQHIRQFALQGVHHGEQVGAWQPGLHPLLHQQQADGFGAQDVAAVYLLPLQRLGALAQCIEMLARLLGHGQRHARGHDLVFHHVVAEQLERQVVASARRGQARPRAGVGRQCLLPRVAGGRHPLGMVLLVEHPGVAPGLHLARRPGLGDQHAQEVSDGLVDLRQPCADPLDEPLARQACQAALR